MRSIFDWKKRSMNFSKRRATDLKGNARVYFPRKARSLEVESSLQTLRDILMTTFRLYSDQMCGKEGRQRSNLCESQEEEEEDEGRQDGDYRY